MSQLHSLASEAFQGCVPMLWLPGMPSPPLEPRTSPPLPLEPPSIASSASSYSSPLFQYLHNVHTSNSLYVITAGPVFISSLLIWRNQCLCLCFNSNYLQLKHKHKLLQCCIFFLLQYGGTEHCSSLAKDSAT